MENSKFGQACKKDKGFFKCCSSHYRLNPVEDARNELIVAGLIKDKKTKYCKVTKSGKSPCQICAMTGWCSKKDAFSGKVKNTFYPGTPEAADQGD